MVWSRLLLACFLISSGTGCASFYTNMLNRSEDNCSWEKERLLRGVPITLKVPTHVRVDVLEKHYLITNLQATMRDGRVGNPVSRHASPVPIRQVNYSFIETEKMFLVDLKRPAAGTINAVMDLDPDNQYLASIKTKVEDETIKAVGDLIATLAPGGLFGVPTSEGLQGDFSKRVKEVSSVAASQVFEVDAADFELQVMAFLDRHLNCCHDCSVVPPGTVPPWVLPDRVEYQDASRTWLTPAGDRLPPIGNAQPVEEIVVPHRSIVGPSPTQK